MNTLKCLPNTCLLYAMAMVLDCSVMDVKDWCMGEAQEQIDGHARGHIMEDFLWPMAEQGHGFIPYTLVPATDKKTPYYSDIQEEERLDHLDHIMSAGKGILTGFLESGLAHAMAWDGHRIYDPMTGTNFPIQDLPFDFIIHTFWLYTRIKSE